MKTLNYTCKFCRRPGTVEYEEPGSCPINLSKYEIACNRCAAYHRKRSDWEHLISKVCQKLTSGRMALVHDHKELAKLEEGVREVLKRYTLAYAKLVCAFKMLSSYTWDEDFVNELMGKPDKCFFILSFYRKNVGKIV